MAMDPDDADAYVDAMDKLSRVDFSPVFIGRQSRERCGIITNKGVFIEWPNQHVEPRYNFRLPGLWVQTARDNPDVGLWAIWHTHPKYARRRPTPVDLQSIPYGVLGVVIHVGTRLLTLYVTKRVVGTMKYRG